MSKLRNETSGSKYVLKAKPALLAGLRLVPAVAVLAGAALAAPAAGATPYAGSCHGKPTATVVNGGTVVNDTRVSLSADGGTADAEANGGDGNQANGGAGGGGLFGGTGGDGGQAGNGGDADANANGGEIKTGDISTGNNRGNAISVQNCGGAAVVNGGTVVNDTRVDLSADGGDATAEANGGDNNQANGGAGGGGLFGGAGGNGGRRATAATPTPTRTAAPSGPATSRRVGTRGNTIDVRTAAAPASSTAAR
jgi:hypothetical protein